jgi:hypothetical protein
MDDIMMVACGFFLLGYFGGVSAMLWMIPN